MTKDISRPKWFSPILNGWLVYPSTIPGYVITLIYAGFMFTTLNAFADDISAWPDHLFYWFLPAIAYTSVFFAIAYSYGEKPQLPDFLEN